ncbi:hypothetical protein Tco_0867468 [Tanacetum coccineum]
MRMGNSRVKEHVGRVIHHQTHPIGQSHVKNDTLDDKKAQERWDFTLLTLSKEAQAVSITDCQAGNPCEISRDLTDEIYLPMIEGLYGYDWQERLTNFGARRVLLNAFFNTDLQYLLNGNKDKEVCLLITNHQFAEYNIRWIEEEIRRLFRKNIIEYDENDALDIRIKSMKEVKGDRQFDYGFLESIIIE